MFLCPQSDVQNYVGFIQTVMTCANINNAQRFESAVTGIYDGDGSVLDKVWGSSVTENDNDEQSDYSKQNDKEDTPFAGAGPSHQLSTDPASRHRMLRWLHVSVT